MRQDPAGCAPAKRSQGRVGKAASASCVLPARARAAGHCQGCHGADFNLQAWKRALQSTGPSEHTP